MQCPLSQDVEDDDDLIETYRSVVNLDNEDAEMMFHLLGS